MEWYEEDVRALEKWRCERGRVDNATVFYGSSTIRLWTNLAGDLGDRRAVNLGFGGSTLEACAYFFERLVPPEQPASLVIYAGDNDLGDGRSPEQVLDSFRTLAAKALREIPGVPLGFISIKPSPARFPIVDRIRRANDLVEREMEQIPRGYFVKTFDAMLDTAGNPRPELYLEDGLHLSPAGYGLWTHLLEPWHDRIFPQARTGCNAGAVSSRLGEPGIPQMV